jgi:hypothetical protein
LSGIERGISETLGLRNNWDAELRLEKLQIYRKGDSIAPTQQRKPEGDKGKGWIGTLFVSVTPSRGQGGKFVVTGRWETSQIRLQDPAAYSKVHSWLAIIGDTPYQMLPVKSDKHLCLLTFSIVIRDVFSSNIADSEKLCSNRLAQTSVDDDVQALARAMWRFWTDEQKLPRFAIVLDNAYTEMDIQPHMLRGTDVLLYRACQSFLSKLQPDKPNHVQNKMTLFPILIKCQYNIDEYMRDGHWEDTTVYALRRSDLLWALERSDTIEPLPFSITPLGGKRPHKTMVFRHGRGTMSWGHVTRTMPFYHVSERKKGRVIPGDDLTLSKSLIQDSWGKVPYEADARYRAIAIVLEIAHQ